MYMHKRMVVIRYALNPVIA